MGSLNQVYLVGNLTRDPELRRTPGEGKAVCTFTVAVDNGQKKEGQPEAEFIPVTVWEKSALACAEHLMKGSSVLVSARLKVERWEAENGQKCSRLAVIARSVQFLGRTREKPAAGSVVALASTPGGAEEVPGGPEDLEEGALPTPEEV